MGRKEQGNALICLLKLKSDLSSIGNTNVYLQTPISQTHDEYFLGIRKAGLELSAV